jgi:hypothetical protein
MAAGGEQLASIDALGTDEMQFIHAMRDAAVVTQRQEQLRDQVRGVDRGCGLWSAFEQHIPLTSEDGVRDLSQLQEQLQQQEDFEYQQRLRTALKQQLQESNQQGNQMMQLQQGAQDGDMQSSEQQQLQQQMHLLQQQLLIQQQLESGVHQQLESGGQQPNSEPAGISTLSHHPRPSTCLVHNNCFVVCAGTSQTLGASLPLDTKVITPVIGYAVTDDGGDTANRKRGLENGMLEGAGW